jgi:hypothetical protein
MIARIRILKVMRIRNTEDGRPILFTCWRQGASSGCLTEEPRGWRQAGRPAAPETGRTAAAGEFFAQSQLNPENIIRSDY